MTLPSLCSADLGNILPISAIEIKGKQNDLSAMLHVIFTYVNNSLTPISITYSAPTNDLYNVSNPKVYINGANAGLIERPDYQPRKMSKTDSMELGLLDVEDEATSHIGTVQPNQECQLDFAINVRIHAIRSDLFQTSINMTVPSLNQMIPISQATLPNIQINVNIDIVLSGVIASVTSETASSEFESFSSSSGALHINSMPDNSTLEYQMKLTTVPIDFNKSRPKANETNRTYTFPPLLPSEACSKLVEAKNASTIPERAFYLAQAAHGLQLSHEEYITQLVIRSFPDYNGDLLTLSKNTGTELITMIQPSNWIKGKYSSVISPYEGYDIDNFLNLWDGRSFPRFVLHTLLVGAQSITCFVLLLLSAVIWGLSKKGSIGIMFGSVIAAYIAINLFFIFRRHNYYSKRLNDSISHRMLECLTELRNSLPPGYVNTSPNPVVTCGVIWKELFYEPAFDILLRSCTSLARNPSDPMFTNPRDFRALLLLHRYVMPLVFGFNDESKMNQVSVIVKSFRKVIVNGLLQGSEEVKSKLEQMICDALLEENVRQTRPLNFRHITMDTVNIIELFRSIANAAAGRTDIKGEEIRHQFSKLNDAISNAEKNGIIDELKDTINHSPYLSFYL